MHDAETSIAAIHRDWGEAQGNYDEFRFFTGLRPSEQIAFVLSDLDVEHGIISINKARVAGVDRCKTKTGEDRRVQLCPRALQVLRRQLRLRERLAVPGSVRHDQVFVYANGEPMRDSQVAAIRWRKTLLSLKVRYRRPYTARHSSVSWNLMLDKNVLWVAKQHGHSIMTMLRTYAAWTEGAVEADVQAIERAMGLTPRPAPLARAIARCRHGRRSVSDRETRCALDGLAVDLPVASGADDFVRPVATIAVASAQSLTCCSSGHQSPCHGLREIGWGGWIRTTVWRDQNPDWGLAESTSY